MLALLLDTDLNSTQRDYGQTAQACGRALIAIINEVLDRAKIEAGKLELEEVPFDPWSILDDVLSLFSEKSRRKGIDLAVFVSDKVPEIVMGDPGRFRQVITNLVGNSVKSSVLHSQPKSTLGTPAYIAPEVLLKKEYDGKIADVWSCGVTLYVMLVGAYPFEDPDEPRNFRKTIQRILNVQYSIPDYVHISPECHHLISRIFVADPAKRINIPEIKNHEWFLKNLPADLGDDNTMNNQYQEADKPSHSLDEIMQIITEATHEGCRSVKMCHQRPSC